MILGAWIFQGKRDRGRPLKSLQNSYLDLLRKLKFDDEDPVLGSKYGEWKCICLSTLNVMSPWNLIYVKTIVFRSDIREISRTIH